MSTTIAAVNNNPNIVHSEFIRLTMTTGTYTFCSAASPITVAGVTYTGLGSLLSISNVTQDVKSTSKDLTISLAGVDGTNVGLVLQNNIKGSVVEVWRGFFDSNNQILTIGGVLQFFKRYQGIVNNINIQETFDNQLRRRIATVSISCASFKVVLQNRISGEKTTSTLWQNKHPNDTSMNRVAVITAQYFDFGKAPTGGGQPTPTAPANYSAGSLG
jgi:hypothetical protein